MRQVYSRVAARPPGAGAVEASRGRKSRHRVLLAGGVGGRVGRCMRLPAHGRFFDSREAEVGSCIWVQATSVPTTPVRSVNRSYPAFAESVPLARNVVSDFAAEAGLAGDRLESIRL